MNQPSHVSLVGNEMRMLLSFFFPCFSFSHGCRESLEPLIENTMFPFNSALCFLMHLIKPAASPFHLSSERGDPPVVVGVGRVALNNCFQKLSTPLLLISGPEDDGVIWACYHGNIEIWNDGG